MISANREQTKPDKEEKRIRLNAKGKGMRPDIEKKEVMSIDVERLPDTKGLVDTEKSTDVEGSVDT